MERLEVKVFITSILATIFTAANFLSLPSFISAASLFGLLSINAFWGDQVAKRLHIESILNLPKLFAFLLAAGFALILLTPEYLRGNVFVQSLSIVIFAGIGLSYAALGIIMSFVLSGNSSDLGRRALIFVASVISFQFMCIGVFFISARLNLLESIRKAV